MMKHSAILLLSMLSILPSLTFASNSADSFLKGKPSCFRIQEIKDIPWKFTLKLIGTRLNAGPGVPIVQVNGLMHGRREGSDDTFYAELAGTATIATNIGSNSGPATLQIGLFEADFAPDDAKTTSGIWIGHFGLELRTSDLAGMINGKYEYTPVKANGNAPVPQLVNTLSERVDPIDCRSF